MIYLIGSLRNPRIPEIGNQLRQAGHDVFSSWFCASDNADDRWQEHEMGRGLTYTEALNDYAAQHVIAFDQHHLNRCRAAVLVYPAGRSAHTEMGYVLGQGKQAFVLLDGEPQGRWEVMVGLATAVVSSVEELIERLARTNPKRIVFGE